MDVLWVLLFAALCAGIGGLVAICTRVTARPEVKRP